MNNRLLKLSDSSFDEFQWIILQKHVDITKIKVHESFKLSKPRKRDSERVISVEWNCNCWITVLES